MTDIDRGGDEDRLPWLEAVDDEDEGDSIGLGKLIAAVVVALVAIGLVIGGVFWLRERRQEGGGEGGVIAAPQGDYKVPANGPSASGMAVEGEGDASFAASQGHEVNSTIDVASQPEAPVAGAVTSVDASAVRTKALPPSTPVMPKAPAAAAPAPAKVAAATPVKLPPVARPMPTPAPATSAGSSRIKIGAFSTQALAETGWRKLTGQYSGLSGLSHSVEAGTSNGNTIYRLYASGPADTVAPVCRAMGSGCIKN